MFFKVLGALTSYYDLSLAMLNEKFIYVFIWIKVCVYIFILGTWEDNIKIGLNKTIWEGVDWILLAWDKDLLWTQ